MLYDAGIENKIFHIYYLPKDSHHSSSKIGFGGYGYDQMADDAKMVFL